MYTPEPVSVESLPIFMNRDLGRAPCPSYKLRLSASHQEMFKEAERFESINGFGNFHGVSLEHLCQIRGMSRERKPDCILDSRPKPFHGGSLKDQRGLLIKFRAAPGAVRLARLRRWLIGSSPNRLIA